MKFFKKLLQKIKEPSPAFAVISIIAFVLAVAGVVLLIVFNAPPYISYFFYALSAVLLGYMIYLITLGCKKLKPRVVASCEKHRLTNNFVHDYSFRTMIFALCSLFVNVAYAIFNGVFGIIYASYWNIALATYYIVLCSTRASVVLGARSLAGKGLSDYERERRTLKIYGATGALLIVLTLALNVVLWLMTSLGYGFEYRDMLIYVMAGYTVYKVSMSVYNLVKSRAVADYSVRAVRNVNLADALVSLLALQTAMLSAFSEEGFDYSWWTVALGSVVCGVTLATGLYMIIKSVREVKKLKTGEPLSGEKNG